ncbi:PREDICTED: leucine-rich repeat flightless-interacting protein 1 isoform X1 [Propithecus coquereli]|uniref:leucine-rich repeat flightless-interacting protein 1 isoform X1 n=1 Tax=Propithecus coquereli TaxID=379532 RepID=UPI00063EEB51|nr:PREDICTED: leucine-rich repeat flightless-interacting protein 1 isoform X1 [Propithecus coquereli]
MDMGTQGSGRKRLPNRERLSAEDDALNQIAREAEARLAAKRAARAEAREIRMKELERQQKEVEERPDRDFAEKGSRSMPGLSAATLASLGGTSSRRGSGDTSISIDTEASIREIKDSLAEVEEKYKKAMVSNAQLDNEKTNFMYQVDTLKDMLLELEEQLAESRRQYEEKNKEFEREKHAHSTLQFQFAEAKEALKQREEMLEKHGIILNSEIATNGETSDTLNNVGYQAPTKIAKEELNALKSTGDGTLGRANEVEVKNEIVESVGKRAILQNTEKEQHTEDAAKHCVDVEVRPGGSAEDQQASDEDKAPSLGTLAGAEREEQVQSQNPENTPLLGSVEQVKSHEVTHVPDDRTGAVLSHHLSDLDSEVPGPRSRQGSCNNAVGIENQSKESVEKQEKEKQEDSKSHSEEVSSEPCQEHTPLPTSEMGREGADSCGQSASCTEHVAQAGDTQGGQQLGTMCQGEQRAGAALEELDPSVGCSLEKEVTSQEVAGPQEAPAQSTEAGREGSEEESEEAGLGGEKPVEAGVQNVPGSPAAESHRQEATGPSVVDTERDPLDTREPREEKSDQQAEALESSPRKAKNKKKKNKKKKSTGPAETLKDVKTEVTHQSTDVSEVKEEEQVTFTDGESAVEALDEVTKNPEQNIVAESSEHADCPENPAIELDGKLNQEAVKTQAGKVTAGGDTLEFGDDTVPSSGTSVSDRELDEDVIKSNTKKGGAAQDSPPEPENEAGGGRSPLGNQSPAEETNDAAQTGSAGGPAMPEHPGRRGDKALDSISLESDDSAPAGEAGGLDSGSSEDIRRGSEKGKGKEDCTMS